MEAYLTGVELINFQSHLHTKIDLINGINMLVGTSNSGKSSFIRGLIWNLRNEPSGDEFIKKGTTEAAVITHWSHGYSIERRKNIGGSKNFYILYKDGEVVSEYTGFGMKVPPEIIEVHGVVPLANGVYFNYADQLESAFMISNTPKVRAEIIGNLDELGRIDEEITKINDDIRLAKKEQKRLGVVIGETEKEVDSLEANLKLRAMKINTLRMLKEAIEDKSKISEDVEFYLNRLKQIKEEMSSHVEVVERSKRILYSWDDELPNKIQVIHNLNQSLVRLLEIQSELSDMKFMNDDKLHALSELTTIVESAVGTFREVNRFTDRLKEIKGSISQTEKGFSPKIASLDFRSVDKDVEKFKFLFTNLNRLNKIKEEIRVSEDSVETSKTLIEQSLTEFVEALQKAEICPVCSQSTNSVCTHDIEKTI